MKKFTLILAVLAASALIPATVAGAHESPHHSKYDICDFQGFDATHGGEPVFVALTDQTWVAWLALPPGDHDVVFVPNTLTVGGDAAQFRCSIANLIQGPAGADGTNGTNGEDGAPGTNGADGATGPAGPQGPAGPAGEGSVGATGPAGADGKDGVDGKDGPAGKDGVTITQVLEQSAPATAPSTAPAPAELPRTGSSAVLLALLGFGLLATGLTASRLATN